MSALIRHEKDVHKLDPRRQRMSSAELYGARVERTWSSRVVVADDTSGHSDRDASAPQARPGANKLEGTSFVDGLRLPSALNANDPHPSDGTTFMNSDVQTHSKDLGTVFQWADITSVPFHLPVNVDHEAEHLLNASTQLPYQWDLSFPLLFFDESQTVSDISFSINAYNSTDFDYYDFTGMPLHSLDL